MTASKRALMTLEHFCEVSRAQLEDIGMVQADGSIKNERHPIPVEALGVMKRVWENQYTTYQQNCFAIVKQAETDKKVARWTK